jgi:hypothetical protein
VLKRSDGFWIDILSDNDGVSVNRFQLVGWTVVLGFVFLAAVYQDLAMPVFSETLLTLLGISAGAYVTLKTWENSGVGENNPAPNNARKLDASKTDVRTQTTEAPGQTTKASGQTTEAPGQTTEATGQTIETPGQAAETPGQTTETAGQATEASG